MTCSFNCFDELTLVTSTGTRSPSWNDFPYVCREFCKLFRIFVINVRNTVFTETADSLFSRLDQQYLLFLLLLSLQLQIFVTKIVLSFQGISVVNFFGLFF